MNNIDKTLDERGTRYGEFPQHASITQGIKDAMSKGRNWDTLDDDMKEALEMTAHKIGRILNGDPNYIDSWHDIIGYTRLVEQRLKKEQNVDKQFTSPFGPTANAEPETVAERSPETNPLEKMLRAAKETMEKSTGMRSEEPCTCFACNFESWLVANLAKSGIEVQIVGKNGSRP